MMSPDLDGIGAPADLSSILSCMPGAPAVSLPEGMGDGGRDGFQVPEPGKRAVWNKTGLVPRCDFAPDRHAVVARFPEHLIHTLWKRSPHGPSLSEIKEDPESREGFTRLNLMI